MNETVKTIWNLAAANHQQADTSWQTQQNFLSKFAELIVLECVKIADSASNPEVSNNIRLRFGIKQ